ncbi:MAG: hypothetical protein ACI9W2_002950, partial [Gammaproteobacteria bacterium]
MPAYLITKYDSDDNIMSKTEFPTITEQG